MWVLSMPERLHIRPDINLPSTTQNKRPRTLTFPHPHTPPRINNNNPILPLQLRHSILPPHRVQTLKTVHNGFHSTELIAKNFPPKLDPQVSQIPHFDKHIHNGV